ncbi:acetolactate decarboxylase [Limibacter armeniacum]|uniref:acetolactate decarboxylase n=1 Tax=Limibacter armeniacum TaxID=466084 RepID=UPI002FE5A80A
MKQTKSAAAIYQYGSTLTLFGMVINGDLTSNKMLEHGNYGLGLENNIKSEFIVVNNEIYTIDAVGKVDKATPNSKASYMTMWDFKPEKTVTLKNIKSYKELDTALKAEMESENSFYTYKMKGQFSFLEMGSAIEYKNNETLIENRERRVLYTNHDVSGIMVGHFTPNHAAATCFPGMHFHFISDDLKLGGHLEDIAFDQIDVEIQKVDTLVFTLPEVEAIKVADMNSAFLPPAVP